MKKLLLLLCFPLLFSCKNNANKAQPSEKNIQKIENTESIENTKNKLNLDLDVTIINKSNKLLNIEQPKPNIQKPKPKPNIQKPKPKPNIQKPKPKPKK